MTTTQKLRVHTFSVSVDGYGAGPGQSPRDPLGAVVNGCTTGW